MSIEHRRFGLGVLLFGLLTAAVFVVTLFLARHGFDWSAKFSEIASFVLAVFLALVPVAGRLALWLPAPRVKDDQIATDVSNLAAALRAQGRDEMALPGASVYDRLPMRVRWESAGAAIHGSFYDVIEFFNGLPEQRLVVLGEAGAGKTVLVTEIARSLLAHRGSEDPVPVIFSVVGWNPRLTSLFDWISDQLAHINPDLGLRVSDGRQVVTRAQVLIDRLKVLPILDGLDEVGDPKLPAATLAVSRYGWTQPIVITCRGEEYRKATGEERGTPLARAAVIELAPLSPDDIESYLGPDPDGHWAAVRDRLAAEPVGPLTRVLGNPLMLWLAWEVYRPAGRDPDELADRPAGRDPEELADRYRFARQRAIESRLLSEFVPAVYATEEAHELRPQRRPRTVRRARRWLGFLASDQVLLAKAQVLRLHFVRRWKSADDIVETYDRSVAWWHFTAAAGGFRFIGVALRALVLWAVLWHEITTIFGHDGNWRHGSYAGTLPFQRLFLDGPAGRYVWPTIRQAIDFAPAKTRARAFTIVNLVLRDALAIPSHYFVWFVLFAIPALAGYVGVTSPTRPRRLHVRATLPAKLVIAVALNVAALALLALMATAYWRPAGAIADFFTVRRTWLALLAIAVGSTVYALPREVVSKIDIVGATTPRQSLNEDRLAAITTTVSRRVLFTVTLALFCGSVVATSYVLFAVVSTVMVFVLGGLSGFASSKYTDARYWLALTGRFPWRPMRFLKDAERRGVFYEIGAIFRFRHIRVQLALNEWYRANQISCKELILRPLFLLDEMGVDRRPADSYRALATRNLDDFGQDLISALDRLAARLSQLRMRDEEVAVRGEITATTRKLVAVGKATPLSLAESLERLARCLAEAGLADEAWGVMTDAAEIYRQSAAEGRGDFQLRLGEWIKSFWSGAGVRGSMQELVQGTRAMADLYRELLQAETDNDPPAEALIRLAEVYQQVYQPHDAAAALKRAAELYREQLARAPAVEPELGKLLDVAGLLSRAGLFEQALAALTDAVGAYRMLAGKEPGHIAGHAKSVVQLADLLGQLGRPGERDATCEAIGIYRAVADDSGLPCPPLADLRRLALRLWKMGDADEAVAALEIARLLASIHGSADDAAYLPPKNVDATIRGLASRADKHAYKAVDQFRDIRPSPAEQLDTLAFQLLASGREAESLAASKAAVRASEVIVSRCRVWVGIRPLRALPLLAVMLDELATYLGKTGSREAEAAAAAAEARDIRRRLGDQPSQTAV